MTRPLLLNGYAAKTCAVATQNDFDPTMEEPDYVVPDEVQRLWDDGKAFELRMVEALMAAGSDRVDLNPLDVEGGKAAHIQATHRAMVEGVGLIIGGRLPDDESGARTGKPDLLICAGKRADGAFGYHPGDIKNHVTTELKAGRVFTSTLGRPARGAAEGTATAAHKYLEGDALQLAHYWRMLEACGHAGEDPWGAILGSDAEHKRFDGTPLLVWTPLDEPLYPTYSRSDGKKARTVLERYDHEHGFRVEVARNAQQRAGAPTDPAPMVSPVGRADCGECVWAPVCVDTLPDGDLSRALRGKLLLRDYAGLALRGIDTVDSFVAASPTDILGNDDYLDKAGRLGQYRARLQKAHLAAQLVGEGVRHRPRPGAPDVPRAHVEYDIDCEWTPDNVVYLWGVLRTENGESLYTSFLDLTARDDVQAFDLAERFLRWLDDQIAEDTRRGRTSMVVHYDHAEKSRLARIEGAVGRELHQGSGSAARTSWVDLLPVMRATYDSFDGHGLKVLAPLVGGFDWEDEDAGGFASQQWVSAAISGDESAKQRLLAYNANDVRATLSLRLNHPDALTTSTREDQ